MDLTIETKDYKFSLGTIDMSLVCVFLSSELHFSIDEGVRYMTKKEIQRLIEYLEKTINLEKGQSWDRNNLISNLKTDYPNGIDYVISKIPEAIELPNLIEVQTESFKWLLGEGIAELFRELSPIKDHGDGEKFELHFLDHEFDEPKYSCLWPKINCQYDDFEALIKDIPSVLNF